MPTPLRTPAGVIAAGAACGTLSRCRSAHPPQRPRAGAGGARVDRGLRRDVLRLGQPAGPQHRQLDGTSSRLLEKPAIRNRVAGFLVDQLYANVDVEGEIRAALPPRAQPLAGPAAGALRTFAERAAREVLARPRAQLAWEEANRNAHVLLLKVLEGGGPIVSTENGVVVLDLKQLLAGDAGAGRPRRPR